MEFFRSKRIYLDHASLTPIDPRVLREMVTYSSFRYMNPSSIHAEGVAAKKALNDARRRTAQVIGAHADEIVFTASGTEANNIAILGVVERAVSEIYAGDYSKAHIIVSEIEHTSVLEVARHLEKKGVEVSYIPVDVNGVIDLAVFKKMLRPNTVLVSVMMVNNEIGTIQPVREVVKIVRDARKERSSVYPFVHTDACQAVLYEEINLEKFGVDLLTLDGHKIYGPRGVGMLFTRRGVDLSPVIYGGGQERGLRSGTENIPGIMGFAKALEIANEVRSDEVGRIVALQAYFESTLLASLSESVAGLVVVHGKDALRSPHISNISIEGIDGEFLTLQLDAAGIACSTKSACLHDEDESYVLRALARAQGNSKNDSHSSVRFSFGRGTSKKDIDKVVKTIIMKGWKSSTNNK